MMDKQTLYRNITIAAGHQPADLVIKNCRIVNVFTHEIEFGDIAIAGSRIVGIGNYEGLQTVDAGGLYALPGLIDSHIHVESSLLTPEEFGRALVPCGTTTTISDPHEIVNVCGMEGLEYMLRAASRTALDILYMMPSCVPCTPWEHSGAVIDASDMRRGLHKNGVLGVGEFMNAYGVLAGDESCLDKLLMAAEEGVLIDGHAPGLNADQLAGYLVAGVRTDHECTTLEEMVMHLKRGAYVELRLGSASPDLFTLAAGVTEKNARRCLLCSDDRQSGTLVTRGALDECLRVCVQQGIDPLTAVQMATLNAAECYHLEDRGAIALGRRADIVLVENLKDFLVRKVWIEGELVAEDGRYLKALTREPIGPVAGSMRVKDFSESRLRLKLDSSLCRVIDILPGSLLTKETVLEVARDEGGDFVYREGEGVARISVIERHHGTGSVANALLRGYGIKTGAIAISVAHDSHNIITVGTNTADMYTAVDRVIALGGGLVLADRGEILEQLELPVGGLMSLMSAEEAAARFEIIQSCAISRLGVSEKIDPVMTLCFMSLPVIPELKLTDMGLFHVSRQRFLPLEA